MIIPFSFCLLLRCLLAAPTMWGGGGGGDGVGYPPPLFGGVWENFFIMCLRNFSANSDCLRNLADNVLASVMIHSDANPMSRCPSGLTGYDDCPDSRRCVVRIPRRVIFFSFPLSFSPFLFPSAACPSVLTCGANTAQNFRLNSWKIHRFSVESGRQRRIFV